VTKTSTLRAERINFETVRAVEASRGHEPEAHALSWRIFVNGVTNRAVSANGSHAKRAVKLHRRPETVWPQRVIRRRKAVEKRADARCRSSNHTFMDVSHLHCRLIYSPIAESA
jgi:hypothetical protein